MDKYVTHDPLEPGTQWAPDAEVEHPGYFSDTIAPTESAAEAQARRLAEREAEASRRLAEAMDRGGPYCIGKD